APDRPAGPWRVMVAQVLADPRCRLAHRDAVLPRSVVIGVMGDSDLARRLDQRGENRLPRLGVGDTQRTFPAAKLVVAGARIALHAPETAGHLRNSSPSCPAAPRCRSLAPDRARTPGR